MKRFLFLLGGLLLFSASSLLSQESTRKFLVLQSYHSTLPWADSFVQGLEEIRGVYGNRLEYFIENLDSIRVTGGMNTAEWKDYLRRKYRSIRFDAILAESDLASTLAVDFMELAPGVPVILYPGMEGLQDPRVYGLSAQYEEAVESTLALAVSQNPDIHKALFIVGNDPSSLYVRGIISPLFPLYGINEVEYFSGYSYAELEERAAHRDPESLVFFTPVFVDRFGVRKVPREVLERICALSSAPVYTFWSSMAGSGCVGGMMLDGRRTAMEMVRAAMDYMNGGAFPYSYRNLQMVLDWSAMKHHGIPLSDWPEGALVINRPDPFFVRYYREVLTGIFILLGAFLAIILKVNQNLKEANRKVEAARREAETLSRIDTLTRLYNRRAMLPLISLEMERWNRHGRPVCLLLVDIDHFKRVNDTLGHEAGDSILMEFSACLASVCRKTDCVSRWGGEEFLILTPDTGLLNARIMAEKIRKEIQTRTFFRADRITASIGVAELTGGETFESWFNRVDAAMYRAKASGRNCVKSTA